MTPLSSSINSTRTSAIGAGRSKASAAKDYLNFVSAPVMAACSLAWNPRNRARSSIALLFTAFLLMIVFTENDISAWHRTHFTDSDEKEHNSNEGSVEMYDPLAKLTPEQKHTLLTSIYGSWGFYDGSADERPEEPYMTPEFTGNIYLDLTEDKFPPESWQVDAVYVNHFLDAATKLVRRGQEGIFAAYHGYGLTNVTVDDDGEIKWEIDNADERMTQRLRMFHLEEVDLGTVTSAEYLQLKVPSWRTQGGWTTTRSMDGLERRLLHSMMTTSNFTVVVTGSWQSMGYGGNHGWQSMAGVLEHLLSGLFEKLGVNLVVRAIELPPISGIAAVDQAELLLGGRSTLANTLGWSSIYGSDVDMVIWDDYSAINTNSETDNTLDDTAIQLFDLFARQALLSGSASLPFLWGGDFDVLRNLHESADVDVGMLGSGLLGVPETTSESMASSLPWSARYLHCPSNKRDLCEKEEHKFNSQCWVHRTDVDPPTAQSDHIPILPTAIGWRMHQLKGHTVAYNLLSALLDAMKTWSEKTIYEGHPLAGEYWHMGDYITNVQEKVKALDESSSKHCFQLQEKLHIPKRLCQNKVQGRTEYTPRANPTETSLKSIVLPSPSGNGPISKLHNVYEGKDVDNPVAYVPIEDVSALDILELRKQRRRRHLQRKWLRQLSLRTSTNKIELNHNQRKMETVEPGEGWRVLHAFPGDNCDGSLSSSSSCGRIPSSTCLMEGHQGSRGGIWGDKSAGWIVMLVPGVEHGFVALNLDLGSRQNSRRLEELPDSFILDYAIGDAVTELDKTNFLKSYNQPVGGMGLLTILDDEASNTAQDIKVAVRVRGCSDEACQIGVTHVYWS